MAASTAVQRISPYASMTVADAAELLKHPVFGDEECIYARDLVDCAAEIDALRGEPSYRSPDLDDMTMSDLRAERNDIYGQQYRKRWGWL